MYRRMTAVAAALIALAGASPAARAQFVPGDLYLISSALGDPTNCFLKGILHIDTQTWQSSIVTTFTTAVSGVGAYDAYRDRLIVVYSDSHLELVDSAGARTPLAYQGAGTAMLVAPSPAGRIYVWGTDHMRYFGTGNSIHDLLDQTGLVPFSLGVSGQAMIYDPRTNALFVAASTIDDLTLVTKIPLNAAGTAVQGQPTSVSFDVSPDFGGERPTTFSAGPNGTLFLKIDDNSNATLGRLRTIDPVTLNVQVFASSGYQGVGGEITGVYLPNSNAAVVVDTLNNELRSFAQNSAGQGIPILVNGVSSNCNSGEASQLILIPGCYANCDRSTVPPVLNVNDFICFQTKFASGDTYANCDSSTQPPVLNVNDFICFQTRFAAGCQ